MIVRKGKSSTPKLLCKARALFLEDLTITFLHADGDLTTKI